MEKKQIKKTRPINETRAQIRQTAKNLCFQGYSNKYIAEKLGYNEKTIGIWVKEWKPEIKTEQTALTNLKNRLLELTNNPNSSPTEIKTIIECINKIKYSIK